MRTPQGRKLKSNWFESRIVNEDKLWLKVLSFLLLSFHVRSRKTFSEIMSIHESRDASLELERGSEFECKVSILRTIKIYFNI